MLRCRSNTASKTGLEFILSLTLEPIYWAKLMLRSWLRMGRLLADGRTAWDALRALRALSNTLSDAPAGNFSFAEGYRLEVPRTDNLRIMSYNILLTASSLTARKPLVTRVVAEQLPDSLGLQVVTSGLDFLPQGSPWRGV